MVLKIRENLLSAIIARVEKGGARVEGSSLLLPVIHYVCLLSYKSVVVDGDSVGTLTS